MLRYQMFSLIILFHPILATADWNPDQLHCTTFDSDSFSFAPDKVGDCANQYWESYATSDTVLPIPQSVDFYCGLTDYGYVSFISSDVDPTSAGTYELDTQPATQDKVWGVYCRMGEVWLDYDKVKIDFAAESTSMPGFESAKTTISIDGTGSVSFLRDDVDLQTSINVCSTSGVYLSVMGPVTMTQTAASDSSTFCDGISSSQLVTKDGITAYCDADTFPGESWAVVWTSTKDHAVSHFDDFWASLHQSSNTIPIPSQSSAEGSAYDLLCPSAQQCRLALVCEGTDRVKRWMKWSQGTDGSRLVSPSNELNSCAEQGGGGITCDYSYTNFGELEESSGFSGTPAHAVFRENPNTGYRYRWGMGTGTWDVLFGVDINDGEYDCGGSQARWWAVEIFGGAPIDEATTTTTTTTTVAMCDSFYCGADAAYVPNAATVEGNNFATCCRCQFGSNLLWGAHANGTFHGDSNPWSMEMWLDIPKVVTMEEITWANAQNDDLRYSRGQTPQTTEWNSRSEGECRTRWTLAESLDTFFGTGSRFTYDRDADLLEGMFEFKADRSMSRIISGHENVYVRHITQDVPVLFSLEKTAKVEATFKTSVTALEYDIAITGIAEETFSENGEIVLDFNILSSSCMEKSVTLKTCLDDSSCGGQDFINGDITSIWSDESMWHPSGMDTASCSQDVTVTFKRKDGEYNLPLVFEFQIQAANNSGEKIDEEVNLHIEEATILDSLPIQTTMSFYLTEARINPAESFGLGHTVYGRITTTTVVDVDSIVLSSLVLEQMGYDNVEQTFDLMQLTWAEYQGEYPAGSDHFDFSFMLKSTDLHITASDANLNHLATIKAAIAVTYKDESHTRRQLAIAAPPSAEAKSDAAMTATNSFAITAADNEENVGALFEITPAHKSHFLKWSAAGGFLALFLYCVRRQTKYQNESYSPLLVDDEI